MDDWGESRVGQCTVAKETNVDIKVKELLKSKGEDAWTVAPKTSVLDALKLMAEKNIGAVLVTEGEELVGIFSERDYVRKVALDGKSCDSCPVGELMTQKIISIDMNTTLQECLTLINDNRIRHLPVVENGRLHGMLTIGDVVKHIISHLQLTVRDLEAYITGSGYGG